MPLDIQLFRDATGGDSASIRKSEERRYEKEDLVSMVIEADKSWIAGRGEADEANKQKNKISNKVKDLMKEMGWVVWVGGPVGGSAALLLSCFAVGTTQAPLYALLSLGLLILLSLQQAEEERRRFAYSRCPVPVLR